MLTSPPVWIIDNSLEANIELPTEPTDAYFLILRGLYFKIIKIIFNFPIVVTFVHLNRCMQRV